MYSFCSEFYSKFYYQSKQDLIIVGGNLEGIRFSTTSLTVGVNVNCLRQSQLGSLL